MELLNYSLLWGFLGDYETRLVVESVDVLFSLAGPRRCLSCASAQKHQVPGSCATNGRPAEHAAIARTKILLAGQFFELKPGQSVFLFGSPETVVLLGLELETTGIVLHATESASARGQWA